MPWNVERVRSCLRDFDFQTLFTQELGWDHHHARHSIHVDGQEFALTCFAQKRGVQIFECAPDARGAIPDYGTRRKIEKGATKLAHEHLIIFVDGQKNTQIWQWVLKEPGRPAAYREQAYDTRQSGQPLIEKLAHITFPLSAEEGLTLTGVTITLKEAFDKERVTRRFYDRFKAEHAAFLEFLRGIPDAEMQRWYASVMLNRLMFIYFIQKRGFLDGDTSYLHNKLARSKQEGKDRFYSHFLCPLFFEGFARKETERSAATNLLLGNVPYLNGGLFLRHQVEELHGQTIRIANAAFEKLFGFFDQYQWHLDERPLRADNEINPDVLGYIFEKYINQKQMGAYYTKEDITGYIARNTVIPYLFEAARQKCRIAFEGEHSVWRLLREDPDRYFYDAVKKGTSLPLPPDIAAGLNDVSQRGGWNRPAPEEYALPTEIWREVVARHKRHKEVWCNLTNGDVHEINDLITYNLDICQFAQDVIQDCEGPDLLRAFWQAIQQVTVLDPTCGSGAFLFAALNILEPLYEACLDRMQVFLEELELSGEKHHPEKFSDFRKILARVDQHPSRRYFILKSIILNNLFGVDIMDEAVEICKLRLFLKLVAQVEHAENIEPLPDIDFNIRAGNTLVGFASYQDVQHAITYAEAGQMKMLSDEETATMKRIEEKARDVDQLFTLFRQQQTELGSEVTPADKLTLRNQLESLEDELNLYLAKEYGIELNSGTTSPAYQSWLGSHKPFHWFIEFYGIVKEGGFDVIIGNPPYVEYSAVRREYTVRDYQTEACGNLYAFMMERATLLIGHTGRLGLIVPVSSICADGYQSLRQVLMRAGNLVISSFNDRPGRLFEGLEHARLSIILCEKTDRASHTLFTTKYNRWHTVARPDLLHCLTFVQANGINGTGPVPKLSVQLEGSILRRSLAQRKSLGSYGAAARDHNIYYTRKISGFLQILDFIPAIYDSKGSARPPSELKSVSFQDDELRDAFLAMLNSNLFFWLLTVYSDCRNLNKREVHNVPLDVGLASPDTVAALCALARRLMSDLRSNSRMMEMRYEGLGMITIQCIYPKFSKRIIDQIDHVLAGHYGFSQEELDFIINYDIKYRMGRDSNEEDGE
ncbi:MAG: Eco57I restriction-modification methylase domain-containing protein [Chloroflexi bacterium]|nr:Eco57I restriction-modification methylase domain-containing protein [Chloroflexota bacterium]